MCNVTDWKDMTNSPTEIISRVCYGTDYESNRIRSVLHTNAVCYTVVAAASTLLVVQRRKTCQPLFSDLSSYPPILPLMSVFLLILQLLLNLPLRVMSYALIHYNTQYP